MTNIQLSKSKVWFPIIIGAMLLVPVLAPAENWPEFRGLTGQGHSGERGLPLTWSETENVAWKTAVSPSDLERTGAAKSSSSLSWCRPILAPCA